MKEKEVISFNDKEYTIVSILKIDNVKYAYIINIDNYNDVYFVVLKKDELTIVEDKQKLKELIKIFNQEINKKKLSEK